MSSYTLTIEIPLAARQALKTKGYNLVFAKGVSSGAEVDYNAAWITLKTNEMAEKEEVSWYVDYYANYMTSQVKDKAKITGTGNDLKMDAGGAYVVNAISQLIVDPNVNPNPDPSKSSFSFHNDQGYGLEYVPILESLDNENKRKPIWTASTGVTKGGQIAATPVEIVRVWAGKYEQGQAVLADYATVVAEFDLTNHYLGNKMEKRKLASVVSRGHIQRGQKHRSSGNFNMESAINAVYLEWEVSQSPTPYAVTFEVWVDIPLAIDPPLFHGQRLKNGDKTPTTDENIGARSLYIANPQGTDSNFLVTVYGYFN